MNARALKLQADEIIPFVEGVFPAIVGKFTVLDLAPMRVRLKMHVGAEDIRPGGTVSGPAMFSLADCAFYIATMAMIGPEALTVTTNASINFLNKPAAKDMVCEARILKLGKLLSTGDATIWTEGDEDRPVAHAILTYAIPPKSQVAGGS